MSRYHSYLNSAATILRLYDGGEPFAQFLKKYFAAKKKFGSGDRKQVTQLCYSYFRTGKAFAAASTEEKILAGLFLCSYETDPLLEIFKPEWNAATGLPVAEKAVLAGEAHLPEKIFPFSATLSQEIKQETFALSHLQQPMVFLRLRPGKIKMAIQKLNNAGIPYEIIQTDCLQLPAAAKLEAVLQINEEAVIQDYSSQRIAELLREVPPGYRDRTWDCCAASGGKSILAWDLFGPVELTATDIRESILANLRKRFAEAGIKNYKAFTADLTRPLSLPGHPAFSLLLADLPCSGSGTWGRAPEQLFYFEEKRIRDYSALQRTILSNALPLLKPGGYLLYSTCSVFREENEDQVASLQQDYALELVSQKLLAGYERKADTLFAALLRKPL